jgi:hypothetical protein
MIAFSIQCLLVLLLSPGVVPGTASQDKDEVPVVVAARDLQPLTVLTEDDVTVVMARRRLVPETAFGDRALVIGRVVRRDLVKGQVVQDVDLSSEEAAEEAREREPAEAEPAWRWLDREREPFHAWHTDAELQRRLYDEALDEMQRIVGVALTESFDVVIAPAYAFAFVTMETGAKAGSLEHDIGVSRALEWLRLQPADQRARTIGSDWRGDPGSVTAYVGGMYVPKHVRRMIVLNADRTQAQAAHALRHELVRAMQDELFPFSEFFNFDGITIDEKWARQALEEGYADRIIPAVEPAIEPAAREPNEEGAAGPSDEPSGRPTGEAAEAGGAAPADPAGASDPSIRLTGFFYGAGRRAVDAVAGRAASRRELLELVFDRPAATTREVLHPEIYERFLDSSERPDPPEPERVVGLISAVVESHMQAGQQPAWATRLGGFGLSSVLMGIGEAPAEAARLASSWRNDTIVNFGEMRQPVATSSLWVLEDDAAAAELSAAMQRLAGALGDEDWQEVTLQVGDRKVEGHSLRLGDGRPDVLLAREGEVVAYLAGDDLDDVLATLSAGP